MKENRTYIILIERLLLQTGNGVEVSGLLLERDDAIGDGCNAGGFTSSDEIAAFIEISLPFPYHIYAFKFDRP